MAGKRSYDDGCGTAHALELIGERWALLVVRELLLGPKRFTDLRDSLPGISPNVLTQRLEELERAAILRRRRLPPPAASWVYDLTPWGMELEPLICAFGRWAARSPTFPEGRPMSVNSIVLSLRTMFDPESAAGFETELELNFGEASFRVRIAKRRLEIVPGRAQQPDVVIAGDPDALAAVVYAGRDLAEAQRQGELRIEGKMAVAKRFVTLFPVPAPAPAAGT